MVPTHEVAKGRWRGLLLEFGVGSEFLKGDHCSCPMCGGKDRFRFADDKGEGNYFCSQCGDGNGWILLNKLYGWSFKEAAQRVDTMVGNIPAQPIESKEAKALEDRNRMIKWFKESTPITEGDPVWRYLESRCGNPVSVAPYLRFHPALFHSQSRTKLPAMLAPMSYDPTLGRYLGMHRTWLNKDIEIRKKTCGSVGNIQLSEVEYMMGIAEGIETAICASKLFEIPVWSACNATTLENWEPPEGCQHVVIFGDNDASFTGQDVAYSLARRLRLKGYDIEVEIPYKTGQDWCDVYNNR